MNKSTLLIGGLLLAALQAVAGPPATPVAAPQTNAGVEFVANQHQWEPEVLFAANVPGGSLFLTPGRLVQARYDAAAVEAVHDHVRSASAPLKAHAYGVTFVGANAQALVQGEAQRSAHTSFFLGNDPKKWASNVPAYGAVRYQALYPGTDLRFYSHENQVEYDFELAAGADASQIQLRYDGQESLRIQDRALRVGTSVGTVVEQRPYAYQLRDGRPEPVACAYVLGAKNTVSFALPQGYDHSRPLVIDPVLVYASYTGSPANNWGYSSTYDAQGNLYCGGIAFSLGFPVTMGAYSTSFAGAHDLAIMKFNPAARTGAASLLYATYIGGASAEHPHSLLVDAAGNLLIYGSTSSVNYPTTPGAYDTSFNGNSDIVVTRLSATGSALLASTFVGGLSIDGQLPTSTTGLYKNFGDNYRGDLVLDRTGNVYVASCTQSADFPRIGGVQNALGGTRDAAVFKLTPSLATLEWSTFLGGSGEDAAYSIQLDSLNNVFVCGGTQSANFPGTAGGLRPVYGGGTVDGFVARISATGNSLTQSTYLGTSGYDQAYFLQLDRQGQVYIFGQTDGAYPVSPGVYSNPNSMQFIHKMPPSLTTSSWSTVIGNGRVTGAATNISPTAFLVNDCGQILLSGYGGNINNMPVTPDAIKLTPNSSGVSSGNGDFYIMQLSPNAGQLLYGTYYGNGSLHVDGGASRFDKSGVIYQTVCISGGTFNPPVTTTPNAWAALPGATPRSALAFKIDVMQLNASFIPATSPTLTVRQANLCVPAQFYFNRPATSGTSTLWSFGNGQTSTQANNATATYTTPGKYAVRLTVFDVNNCLQSVTTVDTVAVYAMPQPQVAASSRIICAGSSVMLSATNRATGLSNVTYTWTAPGQPTRTGPSISVSPATTTRYTVTLVTPAVAGGCTATDTVTIKVLPRLVVAASPPRSICAGTPTVLSATNAGSGATYTWTAPGQPTLTGQSITVSPLASVRYLVRVVNNTGCVARDSVQITVLPRPVMGATVKSPNMVGRPVSFANATTGATSYRWDFDDNTPASTEANPVHVYATARTNPAYQVRLTAFYGPGCEESIVIPVLIRSFELPNIITPNGDGQNETFRPFVTAEKVDVQIFNRWGRLVFEQKNYTDGWGDASMAAGIYYYRLVSTSGESWKGWIEVVK